MKTKVKHITYIFLKKNYDEIKKDWRPCVRTFHSFCEYLFLTIEDNYFSVTKRGSKMDPLMATFLVPSCTKGEGRTSQVFIRRVRGGKRHWGESGSHFPPHHLEASASRDLKLMWIISEQKNIRVFCQKAPLIDTCLLKFSKFNYQC